MTCSAASAQIKSQFTGVFKWAETHQETGYTNWQQGEPNDEGHHEDCVYTYTLDGGESFGWNDARCEETVNGSTGDFALCKKDY